MFVSLSVYCLYQKGLVETICYSGIVKPNILVKKLKQRKKKRKKEVWVKHQYRNDRCWRDMWSSKSTFDIWQKNFGCHGSFFWNSITVLKLLRVLSKSSRSSSDHLNLVFESVPATSTCSLVLLAILLFIELFRIRILLFCCCSLFFYRSTHTLAHR